jgi:bifunctional UDP-N-acetylglucosamine pyrophosphorylase/glucosamine-1-phosphate N-acetyltransferase
MISGLARRGEVAPDASLARSTTGLVPGLGAIVMAAGQGTRMRSKLVKVLHPVAGRPMLLYGLDLARRCAGETVIAVIGYQADQVKAAIEAYHAGSQTRSMPVRDKGLTAHVKGESGHAPVEAPRVLLAEQTKQLGTGHAVMQARDVFERTRGGPAETFLILNGDTPLLSETTVRELIRLHQHDGAAVTLLTARVDDAAGYGRIVRQPDAESQAEGQRDDRISGQVARIVEDRDATEAERAIREINVGTYVVDGAFLFKALDELRPQNAQQEYYLTDIVQLAVRQGRRVSALVASKADEALGINTREQLAAAEGILRGRINARWMAAGVTLRDPDRTWIDADVQIGQDTVLYPNVALEGKTQVGQDCVIHSHTRIVDSVLGDRVTVQDSCVIRESQLESETTVGPFAHLRPGAVLRRAAKVGNFVEIKKAELGEGSKANHLSYLGDARIGKHVNIGAGTITCNYDGSHKHETIIEDEVFVGSDTQLVAPVTVGRGAIVAAGSTITTDVPSDALSIARSQQVNREGWAARRRALPPMRPDKLTRGQADSRTTGADELTSHHADKGKTKLTRSQADKKHPRPQKTRPSVQSKRK